MNILYRKAFRELWLYKNRTILAFAGIFIGLYCIGFTLSAYTIMLREMQANYMKTLPASLRIEVENLDLVAVELLRRVADTPDVEPRKCIRARIRTGENSFDTMDVYAVQDMRELRADAFFLESGAFPESANEVLIERDSLKILPPLDGRVRLTVPGSPERELAVSGLVHAPGLPPASMEKFSYAFMSLETLQGLGCGGWFDEVLVRVRENCADRDALVRLGEKIRGELLANGYAVRQVVVPVPGKHPHGDQLASLLFLLQVFAVIAFFAAAGIIVNLLNSIMSTQVRQIAVMKATGARLRDVALPYLLYVFILSVCALAVSLPLAKMTGKAYADFAARILNFDIGDYSVPLWVYAVQIGLGIVTPLVISLYPLYRTCRITVKEGLFGANAPVSGNTFVNTLSFLGTKAKIPFNNILRNKTRTILAVLSLATGGGIFMTAQNILASIDSTVQGSLNTYPYSHDIELHGTYRDTHIASALAKTNIDNFAIHRSAGIQFRKPDGIYSPYYTLKILPDNNGAVSPHPFLVSQGLLDDEPWMRVGTPVSVNVGGGLQSLSLGGVVNEVPPLPFAYIRESAYARLPSSGGAAQHVILYGQDDIAERIEQSFADAEIVIAENSSIRKLREAFVDHLKVIVNFLSVTALLAVFVGGLAIASAIGISIAERRRELGTMRAVGANRRDIIRLVMVEVAIMGGISWAVALLFSYPVAQFAGNEFGRIFLHTDLVTTLSRSGAILWLALSIATALVAAFIPATRAAKAPLREVLAYE